MLVKYPPVDGVPTVMFAKPEMDFTDTVVAQLNKAGTAPAKPAAAAATATPAKANP